MVSAAWAGGVREGKKRQDGLGEGEEYGQMEQDGRGSEESWEGGAHPGT